MFGVAGVALGDIHLHFAWIFHTQLCHTPSLTEHFVTHHLSHTTLSHTILSHTIFHPPSLSPSFTHHLSHTIFDTPLCHTPSFAHNFVTHHLSHTTLSHTIFVAWSPSFTHHGAAPLCVAGVALGDIHLRFTCQAWHLETSTCVWRGRRGACCTWWRAWSPLVARGTAPLCVAGVALGDIHLRFTWQAWHWRTWSPLVARSATPLCHNFVTRSLSHTTFTHTIFHTHNFVTHTIFLCHTTSFIYDFVTHHFFLLVDPPPPPLSFLPFPSTLQHVWITIGRS